MRFSLGAIVSMIVLAGVPGRVVAGDLVGYMFAFGASC